MNVAKYLQQRKDRMSVQSARREKCETCQQPSRWCYCTEIHPFNSGIMFVILLHPLERRRRIASGRMSHLMLENSQIVCGHDFSNDPKIDRWVNDPEYYPVVLSLGEGTKNLSLMTSDERKNICPPGKKLLVFVADGTWGTASKMVRLSKNLRHLPRISFDPPGPSMFRVRQQPKKNCYSTIEAIHHTIELLGSDVDERKHDRLLKVFDHFVTQQLKYVQNLKMNAGLTHRRVAKYRNKSRQL